MKTIIMPSFWGLMIKINPTEGADFQKTSSGSLPGLYAPWQESKQKGFIEAELTGDSLKAVLIELGNRYQEAGVDFIPMNRLKDEVDLEYNVVLNGKDYSALPGGLDTRLKQNDEVRVSCNNQSG